MQGIDFGSGIWAVIHSGSRKYIGRLADWNVVDDEFFNEVAAGKFQFLYPAFELHTGMVPVMTAQGSGMNHIVQVLPVDGTTGPAKLHVRADAVHLFSDMQERDQERHKKLVESFMEQIENARRMASSNIIPATRMPGGGVGRTS